MGPNADLHIASAAILVVLFLFAVFGYRTRHNRRFGIFVAFFATVAACVVLGAARSIVASVTGILAATVVVRMATIVLQGVASMLMLAYTASLCRNDEAFRIERVVTACIPLVIAAGAIITAFFTGATSAFVMPGAGFGDPLYIAVHLCMAFYPIMCIVCIAIYHKMLSRLDVVAVLCASIALLACIAVELLPGMLHPVSFGLTIAVLAVFVMADNPFEYVDSLTFAYDAAAFRRYVIDLITRKRRFSVIVVALQHVNMLNALLGSAVADQAIRQCAQLSMRVGRTRQVYRVRNNAFAFVTFSRRECARVTNELTEQFSHPQVIGSSSVDLDVSVTCASNLDAFNVAEQVTQYIDFLIDRMQAGTAIPEDQHALVEEFSRWHEVRRYLVHAVENNLVDTYVQPIYSLKAGRFASFEVLSRLVHPRLGKVPADEFIEAAESEGLIAALGRQQLESVCRFASKHAEELADRGFESIKVNLSPIELMEVGFASNVIDTMKRWNVDPTLFQFEVTETAATRYGKDVENTIKALCDAGSKICMDDFGSGFANLDSLLTLPFSVVKIDKTLLDNTEDDHAARMLYLSVVEMMKGQGVLTVAEGVETAAQDELVRSLGMDEAQGFFYAKPMPISEILGTIPVEGA